MSRRSHSRPGVPRRFLVPGLVLAAGVLAAAIWIGSTPPAFAGQVVMYKNPTCTCCEKWAEHMERAGFEVETRVVNNLPAIKAEQGIGYRLASCHTTIVGGYAIEGHVPAKVVKRLLEERPAIRGLAVPGMPLGSPGMEGPVKESFNVLAFDGSGRVTVYEAVR